MVNKNVKRVVKNTTKKLKQKVRQLPPGTFRKVGRKAGGLVGFGSAGGRLGSALAALTGHGDYQVVSNSLMGRGQTSAAGLLFDKRGRRGVRFIRREFIGNVTTSTTFVNRSYPINPGLASSFPWFSQIAANYDEWVPNGICYEFKSFLADFNGTNATLGNVIGGFEYDSLDPTYATKVEMESSVGAISLRGNQDGIFGAECSRMERSAPTLYTRTGSIPLGGTVTNYDLGNFQLATTGFSNSTDLAGELWITYDITLFKEQLVGGQVGNTLQMVNVQGATPSNTSPIGSLATIGSATQYGTLKLGLIPSNTTSPDVISLPSYIGTGSYRFVFRWFGSSSAAITFPTLLGVNMSLISSNGAPDLNFGPLTTNGTGTFFVAILDRTFQVTAPGASLTVAHDGSLPLGSTAFTLVVTQVPTTSPQVLLGSGSLPS